MNIYPAPGSYGGVYAGQQAKKPSWPTVVGIISLCVAGLFGLMTIVGPLISAVADRFQSAQQREMMASMPDWFHPYQWIGGLFTIATYAVLAIGGAMLLKRRRAGRTLHVAYALMGILMAIAGLVVMITMMNYMTLPPNAPPQAQAMVKPMMAFSAIFGMVFALAYPTFVLIWFTRPKVVQHIRTWTS
jgi:crotonobetainyl-CoA:carnitine CoA-transferase CaiB-like acyl-CoA transferase